VKGFWLAKFMKSGSTGYEVIFYRVKSETRKKYLIVLMISVSYYKIYLESLMKNKMLNESLQH